MPLHTHLTTGGGGDGKNKAGVGNASLRVLWLLWTQHDPIHPRDDTHTHDDGEHCGHGRVPSLSDGLRPFSESFTLFPTPAQHLGLWALFSPSLPAPTYWVVVVNRAPRHTNDWNRKGKLYHASTLNHKRYAVDHALSRAVASVPLEAARTWFINSVPPLAAPCLLPPKRLPVPSAVEDPKHPPFQDLNADHKSSPHSLDAPRRLTTVAASPDQATAGE